MDPTIAHFNMNTYKMYSANTFISLLLLLHNPIQILFSLFFIYPL